jgi:hypothetical protein
MSRIGKSIMNVLHNYSSLQVVFGGPKGDTAMDAKIILFDDNMQEMISDAIENCLHRENNIGLIVNIILEDGSIAWDSLEDVEYMAEKIYNKLKGNL